MFEPKTDPPVSQYRCGKPTLYVDLFPKPLVSTLDVGLPQRNLFRILQLGTQIECYAKCLLVSCPPAVCCGPIHLQQCRDRAV